MAPKPSGAASAAARTSISFCRTLSSGPPTRCSRPSRCWRAGPGRWCCCLATCRSCGANARSGCCDAPRRQGGRDGGHRHCRSAVRLRPDHQDLQAGSLELSKNATRLRPSARCAKSTAASMHSTSPRSSMRCEPLPRRMRKASITSPISIAIYRRRRRPIGSLVVEDPSEVRGVNSRTELAELSAMMRQKKNEELMAAGVTLIDPATTYIDPDVVCRARHSHPPGCGYPGTNPHRRRRARSTPTCTLPIRKLRTG